MAKILCSYSGIECTVSHFPLYNTARESHHPIFDLSIEKLLRYSEHWASGDKLTHTDNYLLYLALFKATELVQFRVPAILTSNTQQIIANNMYNLMKITELIQYHGSIKSKNLLLLPQFVISPETRTLDNTHHWIKIWMDNYNDYLSGYKTQTLSEQILRREAVLERFIKDHNREVSTYAGTLAEWANLAGSFPTYIVLDENDNSIPMNEYWKRIIKFAAKGEAIFNVPQVDLIDLIEHCEETIHHGSIYAHELMSLLRSAAERKEQYLGLGDIDISNTYRILDASASVEDANILAMIDSAPKSVPIESQYPNKLAYLKAKVKYQAAIAYYAEHPELKPVEENGNDTDTDDTI